MVQLVRGETLRQRHAPAVFEHLVGPLEEGENKRQVTHRAERGSDRRPLARSPR